MQLLCLEEEENNFVPQNWVCCNLSVTVIFPINIKVHQVKCQYFDYTEVNFQRHRTSCTCKKKQNSSPLHLKVTCNDCKENKGNTFNYHLSLFHFLSQIKSKEP